MNTPAAASVPASAANPFASILVERTEVSQGGILLGRRLGNVTFADLVTLSQLQTNRGDGRSSIMPNEDSGPCMEYI